MVESSGLLEESSLASSVVEKPSCDWSTVAMKQAEAVKSEDATHKGKLYVPI